MYIILATLLQVFFYWKFVNTYVLLIVGFVYFWSYIDKKEYTGERNWPLFRSFRLWKWLSPVEYVFPHKVDMQNTTGKRVFLFIPCATPIPLVWGVGLHGDQIAFRHTMHYIVPSVYMWVPIVRDVLLWTGAVTYSMFNSDYSLANVISELLNTGRSVCYAPSNFNTHQHDDLEEQVSSRYPTPELLTFSIEQKIQIIPVIVQDEHKRYRVLSHPWLKHVQWWFYRKIGYSLPLVFWMRIYNATKPPPLLIQFGTIIDAQLYESAAILNQTIREKVDAISVPVAHDKNIKSK